MPFIEDCLSPLNGLDTLVKNHFTTCGRIYFGEDFFSLFFSFSCLYSVHCFFPIVIFSLVMRASKIYTVSSFQLYSIINYDHYTIQYISMTYFTTGSLYFFTPFVHFAHCPPPHLLKPTSYPLSIRKSLDFFLPGYLSFLCRFYLHRKHFNSDTSGQ